MQLYVVVPREVFVVLARFDHVKKGAFDELAAHDFPQHKDHYRDEAALAVGPTEAYDELAAQVLHGPLADHLYRLVVLVLCHVPVGDAWFELHDVSVVAQGAS